MHKYTYNHGTFGAFTVPEYIREIMNLRRSLLLFGLAIVSAALYLGMIYAQVGKLAYPLDDAWIHLTFARNLALRGEFAYLPGQPSAGSTSPLWAFVLAPGFFWSLGPDAWVYTVGVVCLFASALLAYRIARALFPEARALPPLVAVTFVLEWHFNWAAFSGMETLFFVLMILLTLDAYLTHHPLWLVGLIGGLAMVTRPEGVAMLAFIGLHRLISHSDLKDVPASIRRNVPALTALVVGFLAPLLPYVWFNWATSGFLFPNTFYAKQAEFAELILEKPLYGHILTLGAITFVGAQVLLAPGFFYAAWLIVREKRWDAGILLLWWLAVTLVFAVRLPSTFQHGRYEMPVIPATLLLGFWGVWRLAKRLPASMIGRVIRRSWQIAFPILLAVFWVRGAIAIATDAEIMDCMVVKTADWLAANTRQGEILAVHDVGAVGYYLNDRPLLDLAGLITPDVIPFIRDEPRLMQFIVERNARYLVTSGAWHPQMIKDPRSQLVHLRDCPIIRREGGYEMGVYRVTR